MARIRPSKPDSGLGFQVKVSKKVLSCSLFARQRTCEDPRPRAWSMRAPCFCEIPGHKHDVYMLQACGQGSSQDLAHKEPCPARTLQGYRVCKKMQLEKSLLTGPAHDVKVGELLLHVIPLPRPPPPLLLPPAKVDECVPKLTYLFQS